MIDIIERSFIFECPEHRRGAVFEKTSTCAEPGPDGKTCNRRTENVECVTVRLADLKEVSP